MFETTKIGSPFGIRLYLHGTFWLLPLFIFISGLLQGSLAGSMLNVAVVLTIFGCVALHELGHALAARAFGIGTHEIVLYPIGGVAKLKRMPREPIQEIAIALAGPLVNVAIAAGIGLMMAFEYTTRPMNVELGSPSLFVEFLTRVLIGNIGLVIFNLIPAFPMDGGRVARAVASYFTTRVRATRFAVSLGMVFAILFAIVGIVEFNLMLLIIAAFVYLTGRAELAMVEAEDGSEDPRFREPNDRSDPRNGWQHDPRTGVWTYQHPARRGAAW